MSACSLKFTIFFEDPFYHGVFEYEEDGCYQTYKVCFGKEPKDNEVYSYILFNFHNLLFYTSCKENILIFKHINPKRKQRVIAREMQKQGVGTKAMEAIKKQYEEVKMERKNTNKQLYQEKKQRQFELKKKKRKQKHRGH